ncbi:Hypothetical protein PBC10988_31200 [Planctomycetales bacterium 10988]|nr:Hypothetical protein PBC10988_31200 [Planctomycetales bacterium 10988]
MASVSSPHPELLEQTRRRVQGLAEEIERLCESSLGLSQFQAEYLEKVVHALGAVGGVLWRLDEQQQLHFSQPINLDAIGGQKPLLQTAHHALLKQVALEKKGRLVPAGQCLEADGLAQNTTPFLLVIAPIVVAGKSIAVVEIMQRPQTPANAWSGFLQFLTRTTRHAATYYSHRRLKFLAESQRTFQLQEAFTQTIHSSLDLNATAQILAEEGRKFVGTDRISVFLRYGSQYRLAAVSGGRIQIDTRSKAVKALERLATVVASGGQPICLPVDEGTLLPKTENAVKSYQAIGHPTALLVKPLAGKAPHDPPIGVLISEWFTQQEVASSAQKKLELVATHGQQALHHAKLHRGLSRLPLARVVTKFQSTDGLVSICKWLFLLSIFCGLLLAATSIETDFTLQARGTLQPQNRRDVFARADGEVREIFVDHGAIVHQGQLLATLSNESLEQELQVIIGQRQQVEANLESLRSERLTSVRLPPEQRNRLATEFESEEKKLSALIAQETLLRQQLKDLRIESPLTGQVTTWNAVELLLGRPVRGGQLLLSLADPQGPWVLEVQLGEEHLGHLLSAVKQNEKPIQVSFVIGTDPSISYTGTLQKIADRVELDEMNQNVVRLTVAIDADRIPEEMLRPGASASAKLHCGKQPWGFVLFHDVWEFIQREVMFRLP